MYTYVSKHWHRFPQEIWNELLSLNLHPSLNTGDIPDDFCIELARYAYDDERQVEKSRNAEMAALAPEYNQFLYNLNDRLIDLMTPFAEGWFIDKDFFGSASIKAVLPVLVPELSYKELNIHNGNTAQRVWAETVLMGKNSERKDEIMSDLRKYCELDTLAMVKILAVLRNI